MAAIVFPPHAVPRRTNRRIGFSTPVDVVCQVPVSHPRPTPSTAPVVPVRTVGPANGRAGVPAAVYRRRRLGVAVGATAVLALSYLLIVALSSRVGAATTVARPASVAAASVPSEAPLLAYTVRPGDSLWAIARRLQPTGDVRPLVDQLAERNGGSTLQAGQRLDLTNLDLGGLEPGGLDGPGF